MFCKYCGNVLSNDPNLRFCKSCGKSTKGTQLYNENDKFDASSMMIAVIFWLIVLSIMRFYLKIL